MAGKPKGRRGGFRFRMKHRLFFVNLLKSMPNLLDDNLLKVKSSEYWFDIRAKFRKHFGTTLSLVTFKKELINLVKYAKRVVLKSGNNDVDVEEPWKSVYEMYVANVSHNTRVEPVDAKETDAVETSTTDDAVKCLHCGHLYNCCNRCERDLVPFTKSGEFWAEEMMRNTNLHTLSNPFKDKKIENLLKKWQEESLKNRLEESEFRRNITEVKNTQQKMELEILECQQEEAQLKVQTARIKRSIMEYIFSQKLYQTVSDEQIII